MTIDGKYYSEPELMAKFRQMQEREKKYKRLLKAAVGDINSLGQALKDNEITCESFNACKECPFCSGDCVSWRYADDAADLIGGEDG